MIRVDNLVYEYPGKRALDGVSFTVAPETITALVGPNGAGKTTLLRCIAAIDDPFSGRIEVAGIDVSAHPREVHKELGYLSDFFGVYGSLTVRQCLIFAGRLHQLEDAKLKSQLDETVQLLGLAPYLNQRAAALSRGWRQRLGIAQAIIHRPKLLLLDEPASGLDPEARLGLSSLMRDLRGRGMTIVVSSHVLAELEDYCTQMLVLRDGKIIEHCDAGVAQTKNIIEIGFTGAGETLTALLTGAPDVMRCTLTGNVMQVEFSGGEEAQHQLLRRLVEGGIRVTSFAAQRRSLQDMYMSLSAKVGDGKTQS